MIPVLLAALAFTVVSSCLDETLVSTAYGTPSADGEADLYLSISVSRSPDAATRASGNALKDKEELVNTLDVLVFKEGTGADAGKYFVHVACKGTLTTDENKFQVIMPVGTDFIVHVFANCNAAMEAKDFYNSRGKEMTAILKELTSAVDNNAAAVKDIPMHGYAAKVDISKDDANKKVITIPVLRTVASVQVMTKVTEGTDADGNLTLTPGDVTDAAGNKNFDLRELYVYFYPDAGQVAADAKAYESLPAGTTDKTRNVKDISLPARHSVGDTWLDAAAHPGKPAPYFLKETAATDHLGCIYLYENDAYTTDGIHRTDNPALPDLPDAAAVPPVVTATTRAVIGGVYNNETVAGTATKKVTYYRADFVDDSGKPAKLLRNHKYTFSVEKVSGSGYDTPDEAAVNASLNVSIRLIDWENELTHTDFNGENYFHSDTKSVVLPRNANSSRSIKVESDVPVADWQMSFETTDNGTATTTGNSLSNGCYRVTKAADGSSLTFTALKAYKSLTGKQKPNETLIIRAKALKVVYRITQTDTSPDDWSNGGDTGGGVGNTGIELAGLDFIVAPGNVIAIDDGRGGYIYTFAPNQGYCGMNAIEDLFHWNSLLPGTEAATYTSWEDSRDVCRKLGDGQWYTPRRKQLDDLKNEGNVWGTYPGSSHPGRYFGTIKLPTTDEEAKKLVFLPAAGAVNKLYIDARGYYWSQSMSGSQVPVLYFDSGTCTFAGGLINATTISIRCVRDKN